MISQNKAFEKPARTLESLAQELSLRFASGNADEIKKHLETVGYYRLKGYWYKFKSETESVELPNGERKQKIRTDFRRIKDIYDFDRALRFMLLDAIERIEVAVRAMTIHESAMNVGLFGDLCPENYSGGTEERDKLIEHIKKQIDRAGKSTLSIRSYYDNYSEPYPPICIAGEVFDFGTTLKIFLKGLPKASRRRIAERCGDVDYKVLSSWLAVLNDVRNACAHHNRVMDRSWAKVPKIPKKWTALLGSAFPERQTGIVFLICNALLRVIAPETRWQNRVNNLFAESRFSKIPLEEIGLPESWNNHPLWLGLKAEKKA